MTTPREIEAARSRLASAASRLRSRPRERTVESLGVLLDAWSDPESSWQRRLREALPAATGLREENVREGLALGLGHWTGDALRTLLDRELGGLEPGARVGGFPQTSVLLAGSIPMPTLLSLLAPLALGSAVLAKPASRDPVTAPLLRESLHEIDPELGASVEVVSFAGSDSACLDAFLDAGCVVATGSDEAVASVSRRTRPGSRLIGYGHRVSIAALASDAMTGETAANLARDIGLWDQLGCLSPIAVYCVGGDPDRFATDLADALARREASAPLGELPPDAAAAVRAERDGAEMRIAAGADLRVAGGEDLRFTVIREANAEIRPAPLHRFVRVHPVPDRAGLRDAVGPLSRHLAGVALAGFGEDTEAVARDLADLGASRVCRPGTLQTPPLGWHHDNQAVVLPLARVADLETSG